MECFQGLFDHAVNREAGFDDVTVCSSDFDCFLRMNKHPKDVLSHFVCIMRGTYLSGMVRYAGFDDSGYSRANNGSSMGHAFKDSVWDSLTE
jgi:hypothetical protein